MSKAKGRALTKARGGEDSAGRGRGGKKKGPFATMQMPDEDAADEVDVFNEQREHVSLDPRQDSTTADDDDEDLTSSRPGTMHLYEDDDEGEDDDDDADPSVDPFKEDRDEAFNEEMARLDKAAADADKSWGRSKSKYYGSDTKDFEVDTLAAQQRERALQVAAETDAAREEEKEAIRMQRLQRQEDMDEEALEDTIQDMLATTTTATTSSTAAANKPLSVTAKKVQANKNKLLPQPDDDDDDDTTSTPTPSSTAAHSKKTSKAVPSKSAANTSTSTKHLNAKEEEKKRIKQSKADKNQKAADELAAALTFVDGVEGIEQVSKDVSALTSEEKLAMIERDTPELLALLKELEEKTNEIRAFIQPLLQRVQNKELPTNKGISLLQVKAYLLLAYCTDIAFYLQLKAEGQPSRDHPVVKQLVEIRTILEKIRPIDKRLKYQVDKLLKMSAAPQAAAGAGAGAKKRKASAAAADDDGNGDDADEDGDAVDVDETSAGALSAGIDPLRFKPNPAALKAATAAAGAKGKKGRAGAAAADDDADADADGGGIGGAPSDGLYRAPKLSAAVFDATERQAARRRSEAERLRDKASKSSYLRDLHADLSARPESQAIDVEAKAQDAHLVALTAYEEEMMARMPVTRKDKARMKKQERLPGLAESLGDFGDMGGIGEIKEDLVAMGRGKPGSVTAAVKQAALSSKRKTMMSANDDDNGDLSDGEGAAAADRLYAQAEQATQKKKKQKIENYPQPSILLNPEDPDVLADDSRRGAGKKIIANRGLTPSRNKDFKTPRTKYREKARKKTIKRGSQVQTYKGQQSHGYGGEQTGIKTGTVRSRKL